ncbi:MAG: hypothetical protein ACW98K_13180 [Candidatus Kariarchaeaceae archaeon]|jgi:hypothetical protein
MSVHKIDPNPPFTFASYRSENDPPLDLWCDISFVTSGLGKGRVIQGIDRSLIRLRSMISIFMVLIPLWLVFRRPLSVNEISFIPVISIFWVIIVPICLFGYILVVRAFRSYLYIDTSSIEFRNIFRTVNIAIQNISLIQPEITTPYGRPGNRYRSSVVVLDDKVEFQTSDGKKRKLYILGQHDHILYALETFAENNNIDFDPIFKGPPDIGGG